ncbi:MAG: choice-of-anchor V domain-containing protein, partial [Bacteroidota bacterium]|nr:choice-of-anchor V domain-containing protein [Bacteroidota bacterium]
MKKSIYVLSAIAICLLLAPNVFSKLNGSPGAKTDSPMDGNNCTACHSGTVNSGNGLLSVATDIPVQGYTSGQTYSIAVQLIQNTINRFGFEITCEEGNFGSNKTGNFGISDPTTTKFTNNNAAVTHTQSGISG